MKSRTEEGQSAEEVVRTRKLTKYRRVVERAHKRVKKFKLLSVRFQNNSLINSELYFQACVILSNTFFTPLTKF